ncbi:uracil-DNA glycosylase [Sneathiella limimaris]|uniref:uracil-DNA glycosylase n=1 Tax=Sneathiella limimaris TaxID=1964213 RepID=UPI0019CFF60E|nr:uracil-DNA glycosylase [Sneathiella limimaris]
MMSDAGLKEILDFYVSAGVDETIAETPTNWFEVKDTPAKPAAAPSSVAKPAPRGTGSASALLQKAAMDKATAAKPKISANSKEVIERAAATAKAATTLAELKEAILGFEGCTLKQWANSTVFADGNEAADLMLIDRPPSADEDRSGLPFAAAHGEMLTKMLAAIGIEKDSQTYMTSCLPWRPPGGKTPTPEEQAICLPFIERHIELKAPKMILFFGEAAAFVQRRKEGINKLRGKWIDYEVGELSIPATAIFHPHFLMEHPASKRLAWQDLLSVKAVLSS